LFVAVLQLLPLTTLPATLVMATVALPMTLLGLVVCAVKVAKVPAPMNAPTSKKTVSVTRSFLCVVKVSPSSPKVQGYDSRGPTGTTWISLGFWAEV
jgi:hypothetical protein